MTIDDDILKRVGELLAPAGVCVYQDDPAEQVLLVRWWLKLRETPDFHELFPDFHRDDVQRFVANFHAPLRMLYTLDDALNITHAGWFKSIGVRGALIALWFSEELRNTRKQYEIVRACCEYGLTYYDIILFASKTPSALSMATHLGFTSLGSVPYLFGPEPYAIGYLTRDNFKPLR